MMKIIYKNDSGTLSIITPTDEALQFASIDEIAVKDVPAGREFFIVNEESIPSSRVFREAWILKDSATPDGVGGKSNKFSKKTQGRREKYRTGE